MTQPQTFSDRHRRTRSDHAQETAEDYVEAIDQLQTDAGKCRVVDGPLELTATGRQLAAKARKRHEIVYEFLRAIGVSEATAAIDTEGIEHHVSRQTLECFRRLTEQLKADGGA
jgi:DtxR family transcriptional regulator, manganese transport regulator